MASMVKIYPFFHHINEFLPRTIFVFVSKLSARWAMQAASPWARLKAISGDGSKSEPFPTFVSFPFFTDDVKVWNQRAFYYKASRYDLHYSYMYIPHERRDNGNCFVFLKVYLRIYIRVYKKGKCMHWATLSKTLFLARSFYLPIWHFWLKRLRVSFGIYDNFLALKISKEYKWFHQLIYYDR